MKKILILPFLILCSLFYSQKINFESNLQIVYSLDFRPDSTQAKRTDNVVTLYINKDTQKSIFQDDKKGKIDSIIASQKFTQLSSLPMFKTNHVIFKDLKKSEIVYSEVIDKINFGYDEAISNIKWKLDSEKKDILGYECFKAKTKFHGRDYIAWYTKDIPISDGPYKFAGLPGLIIEIYDDKESFHYKVIAITKKSNNILYDLGFNKIERIKLRDSKINNIIKYSKSEVRLNPMEKQ